MRLPVANEEPQSNCQGVGAKTFPQYTTVAKGVYPYFSCHMLFLTFTGSLQKHACIIRTSRVSFNQMVEYTFDTPLSLDTIFSSLADATRRDILFRVARSELTVSEIAEDYNISLAAVSKHLKVLEKARLIIKRRRGKEQLVTLSPTALQSADDYLEQYRLLWEQRYNRLEDLLNSKGV